MHKKINISLSARIIITLIVFYLLYGTYQAYTLCSNRLIVPKHLPAVSEADDFTFEYNLISLLNIKHIQEIGTLGLADTSYAIIALSSTPDGNLQAIFSNGTYVQWDLGSQKEIVRYDFVAATQTGTNFSADGKRVITPGNIDEAKSPIGYQVWDTQTGQMIECANSSLKCPIDSPYSASDGLYLGPSGVLVIEYTGGSITGDMGEESSIVHFNFGNFSDEVNVQKVSVDTSSKYIAYVLDNRVVKVQDLEPFFSFGDSSPISSKHLRSLKFQLTYLNSYTKALIFAPTNSWLAALTNRELAVWNLDQPFFSRHFSLTIKDGYTTSFDRTGDILALGTAKGITFFDVKTGQKITDFDIGTVTALYFSRDNRILIWGDLQGNIHLWAIK